MGNQPPQHAFRFNDINAAPVDHKHHHMHQMPNKHSNLIIEKTSVPRAMMTSRCKQ
jgi:hypothetical protein